MKNQLITVNAIHEWTGEELLYVCSSPNHSFAVYEKQEVNSFFSLGNRRVQLVDESDPRRFTKELKLKLSDSWDYAIKDSGDWIAYTTNDFVVRDGSTMVQSTQTDESFLLRDSALVRFSSDDLWALVLKRKHFIIEKRNASNWGKVTRSLRIDRTTKNILGGNFIETYHPNTIGLDLLSTEEEGNDELLIEEMEDGALAIRRLVFPQPERILSYCFAPHGGELIAITFDELLRLVPPFNQVQSQVSYQGAGRCCYIDDTYLLSAATGSKTLHLIHTRSLQVVGEFTVEHAASLFIDSFERVGDCIIFTYSNLSDMDDSAALAELTVFRVPIAEFLRNIT